MNAQRALPASIGRFRVDGLLGTGAFSAVYLAVDDRIGSDVAIKLLADHHSLDPDIRERFIAEARLLRRLTSPHVVRLYELDETAAAQPFHVLEYVAGGNLAAHRRTRLAAGATVTTADLAHVASDLATALDVLHAERIVHRDLAPKNLLVRPATDPDPDDLDAPGRTTDPHPAGDDRATDRGGRGDGVLRPGEQLVLADLGISKDLADSSGFTAAAGTLGYAAPEQRTVGTVDERVDVYAASAVLAWMITGEHPTEYRSEELADTVVTAGFAPTLAAVLIGGLAHDPAARPPTIARWHDAVLAALGDVAGSAAGERGAERRAGRAAVEPPPRSRSTRADPTTSNRPPAYETSMAGGPATARRRWLTAFIATLLVIAGAVGGIALDRALGGGDEPGAPTVEQLGDGLVRVARTNGEITAAFTAPAALRPGETVRVVADVEGTSDWVWIIPSARTAGTQRIDLTAPSSGSLTLRLVAIGADGTTAEAAYTFPVTEG